MNVIAVRHDLGASQKALLAALSWGYVIDPKAEPCERFVMPGGRMRDMRYADKPCPECLLVAARQEDA